jgi:hypothetical protein
MRVESNQCDLRPTHRDTWRVKKVPSNLGIAPLYFSLDLIIFKKPKPEKEIDVGGYIRSTGKNAAQVEAHEKWYQNLQRLRREQRHELDEWKRQKKLADEEERKSASTEFQQQQESDAWVAQWRRQRETVRKNLDRWKVCSPSLA